MPPIIYTCPRCFAEIKRCALCPTWLHPHEIQGEFAGEPLCHICKIICDSYPEPLPVIEVKRC